MFIQTVARGRKKTAAEIKALAQGRVWTGKQAVERGLVDRIGGLREALREAKKLSGLDMDQPVPVETYPKAKTLPELLMSQSFPGVGVGVHSPALRQAAARRIALDAAGPLIPEDLKRVLLDYAPLLESGAFQPLYLSPHVIRIR